MWLFWAKTWVCSLAGVSICMPCWLGIFPSLWTLSTSKPCIRKCWKGTWMKSLNTSLLVSALILLGMASSARWQSLCHNAKWIPVDQGSRCALSASCTMPDALDLKTGESSSFSLQNLLYMSLCDQMLFQNLLGNDISALFEDYSWHVVSIMEACFKQMSLTFNFIKWS